MEGSERPTNGRLDSLVQNPTSCIQHPEQEPIAIIGISCRFPGGAHGPEAFWRLLCEGFDAISDIPPDRWDVRSFYDPDPETPGKTYARWGGFIKGIDQFDASFFGISPREAACMDPQQRLLLELAYEAIEDGGQVLERLAGSPTGVFIGLSTTDYMFLQSTYDDKNSLETYTATGGSLTVAANRISYCFDLRGPSLIVDTACSASLVALHLACKSIWDQESEMALAGGAIIIICPEKYIAFSKVSMLSPEGRCKAFDASGRGFVYAEGAGIVLLKPVSRALRDGDPIYALILGTAVNQDGRTSGLTVPSQEAQAAVLRAACQQAGVPPEKIQYVEAHGTGTSVGDPIEANALGAVLSANRPEGTYCLVGSVKTNIGHLAPAAGIAGLIKVALSLKHGLIPPSLHFHDPNPQIDFDRLKLRVPQCLSPWPENGGPRYASVSSFGFGGTNAHVVLTEAPKGAGEHGAGSKEQEAGRAAPCSMPQAPGSSSMTRIVPLSARSPEALTSLAKAYTEFLKAHSDGSELSLNDLGSTLSLRRTHHEHRLSLVVHTTEALVENLEAFLAGETRPGMRVGNVVKRQAPKLVFVASGQGPQWWAMGRELLDEEPVFRAMIERCDELLSHYASWSLMEELTASEERSRLQETSLAQPAIFALQVGLAAVWRSWGVEPEAVVGHSVGEVAAAHLAGALSLEEAVRVIFHRARCMSLASSQGRMLAAGLTLEEAEALIRGYEDRVSLAAVNSPSSVTFSGEAEALSEMSRILEDRKVFCSFLRVNYAFHSPQMEVVHDELLKSLGSLQPTKATKLLFSTVTGQPAQGPELDATHWWHSVRRPVRFAQAIDGLIDLGHTVFLELSPHPVLASAMAECLQARQQQGVVLSSLRRKEAERLQMLGSLGALYTVGYPVDWKKQYPDEGRHVHLPQYPWQHESYWRECEDVKAARLGAKVHPLLGRRLRSANPSWIVELNRIAFPYLHDHKVQGHVVFPAAAYVEMALAAAREVFGAGTYVVEELEFQKALFIPESGEAPTVQTTFNPEDSSFALSSRLQRSDHQWTLHAHGKIRSEPPGKKGEPVNLEPLRTQCSEEVSKGECYENLKTRGVHFGASFQGIEQLWRRDGKDALGLIHVPEPLQATVGEYMIHPAVLDACLQVVFGTSVTKSSTSRSELFLPVRIEQVRFYTRPGLAVWSHAHLVKRTMKSREYNIRTLDEDGHVLVDIRGFKTQPVDTVQDASSESMENWMYEVQWHMKARPEATSNHRSVDFLLAAEELDARLQLESDRLSHELGWNTRYQEIDPDLNQLCSAYIIQAFRQLGWKVARGQRVTADGLAEKLGVVSEHRPPLGRFLELLAEDGWLRSIGSEWEVCSTPPSVKPDTTWKSILQRFPALYAELMLMRSCGERLADILRGTVDPLHLIFPEGSLLIAEHLYQDSPSSKIFNLLTARAMATALERLPKGRRVRVLEVGGGTGGTTAYVLPTLPADQVEYVFTDVSPLFLHQAEQKFREYPFLRYQVLDIEKDPVEQGLESHGFDFILASNVLHATSHLRPVLGNVQKLLASEGFFLCVEVDRPSRWVDLVFGLTEGWWRFRDTDLRPSYPLLSRQKWLQLLEEVGFSAPLAISDGDGENEASQAVFIARGPAADFGFRISSAKQALLGIELKNEVNPQSAVTKRWLIFADTGGTGERLAEVLWSKGERSVLIFIGEEYQRIEDDHFRVCPDRPEDFQRLFHDVHLPNQTEVQGVIHCWSLENPPPDQTTVVSLERSLSLGCLSVMHLMQAWGGLYGVEVPPLWLITRGAQAVGREITSVSVAQAPLCGLGRVIVNEHRGLRCRMVDLSQNSVPAEIELLAEELVSGDDEDEVALRGEARYVPRLVRTSLNRFSNHEKKIVNVTQIPVRVESTAPGVLDSLALRETTRRTPGDDEVEIEVVATALNFRDVMKALGIYPMENDQDTVLGDECAGRVTALGEGVDHLKVGDEVIAIAPGSFGSFVTTKAAVTTPKPSHLSFEEAVTIPVAFLTAYYALHHLGRISRGERVLIQAAAGGVGLAAVQIAQHVGAEVFATAGSPEKRAFLNGLGVRHVMDSRSLAFAEEIQEITGGQGVDIVLNSLAGDAIQKGLSCLAPYGRFLEIGKRDIYQNKKLGLRTFSNSLSFFAVDLSRTMRDRSSLIMTLFGELRQLFENKHLHPLPYRVFPIGRVASAFRHMAQAKHLGKIVLSVRNQQVEAEPLVGQAVSFTSEATYLITGGLGGFGLAVAEWMVDNGARHLVLMGRTGAASDEAKQAIARIERQGARVVVAKADVSREDEVARVLAEITEQMPPLRGIVHAAMVLDDGIVMNLTEERFKKVMEPKMHGAWNLHRLTVNLPLEFFVLFSSGVTMMGSVGQGNYVAANAFLDALAHHRRRQGLPALAINWGALTDVGYVARRSEIAEYLDRIGQKGFTSNQATDILGRLFLRRVAQIGVMRVDWRQRAKFASTSASPRLSLFTSPDALEHQTGEERLRVRDMLLATHTEERQPIMESYLRDQVARVFGTSPSHLEPQRPLTEMGLDSLIAVELKNRIEKDLGVSLPTVELMRGPTITTLSQVLLDQLIGLDSASGTHSEPEIQRRLTSEPEKRAAGELLQHLDQLSDQQVDTLLSTLVDERELESLVAEKNQR